MFQRREEQRDAGDDPSNMAGERRATRLSAMRVSIDRTSSIASSGSVARTNCRSESANASGRWLVRVTTKTLVSR